MDFLVELRGFEPMAHRGRWEISSCSSLHQAMRTASLGPRLRGSGHGSRFAIGRDGFERARLRITEVLRFSGCPMFDRLVALEEASTRISPFAI